MLGFRFIQFWKGPVTRGGSESVWFSSKDFCANSDARVANENAGSLDESACFRGGLAAERAKDDI